MAEYGAADDGQVCVAADEVVREYGDEIEQASEHGLVDFHGDMVAVENDAVLVIVDIGGILEIVALPVKLNGDDAVVAAAGIIEPAHIALRLAAEQALGIAHGLLELRRGDGARVLFGL